MSDAQYLKKVLLTNVPLIVTMKKRGSSYPEKEYGTDKLTGRYEFMYIFADQQGNELKHYAKEWEEDTLKLFSPGDTLQIVKQEIKKDDGKSSARFVWTDVGGAEARAAANPQGQSNSSQTAAARKLDAKKQDEDEKWRRIDLSKIIFGYMNTALARGFTQQQAKELAKECYKLQEEAISELLLGIPSLDDMKAEEAAKAEGLPF